MASSNYEINCLVVGVMEKNLQQRFLFGIQGKHLSNLEYTPTVIPTVKIDKQDNSGSSCLLKYDNTIGMKDFPGIFNTAPETSHDVIIMLHSKSQPFSKEFCENQFEKIKTDYPLAKIIWADIDSMSENDLSEFSSNVMQVYKEEVLKSQSKKTISFRDSVATLFKTGDIDSLSEAFKELPSRFLNNN